jgi:hypothetical protein
MQMAAESAGSYYESFRRKGPSADKGLMTDRGAYMSFLEVQLERVSAACLMAQGFEGRLGELASHATAQDERIASLTKVQRKRERERRQLLRPLVWALTPTVVAPGQSVARVIFRSLSLSARVYMC